MSDYLVTIRVRVRVDDAEALLKRWEVLDGDMAQFLAHERDAAIGAALQALIRPPDLSGVPGASLARDAGVLASVGAEPWPSADDVW